MIEQKEHYVVIGPSPVNERCVQIRDDDYEELALAECSRFIDLLRKKFGPEPAGAHLKIMGFNHDYGIYHEVVCHWRMGDAVGREYAWCCVERIPLTWKG